MDKNKSTGLPPPCGRYSTTANVKSEPSPTSSSSDSATFSHDINTMSDNPPRNRGHRRAHSEILTLPDDISFDSDIGIVGADDNDEDLLSMYLDMDKFNSEDNNIVDQSHGFRHKHSQSMDGSSTTINPDMLLSVPDSKKAMSAAKLAELALIDPKRAKRVWANRQSAARSKERKMRYISELEMKVQTLQTEATSLSAQLTILQRDTNGLNAENSEMKLRLQTMEQQVHLQDALNDALKEEIQHWKVLTGQAMPNGGPMNFSSFGGGQQFYSNNQAMHTLLASQQFQQLQIHSQKPQHQLQQQQQHQLQQQQHQLQQQQQQFQQHQPQQEQ
ncbi:probable transcription factor PosF21 [Gastrolobium bilobum]|uniref:probable transcription factor PosF21 n=1 Tax=Gastrolobium bilobum TaxID=150636 RepID=UPI002AAF5D5A|nr:probable transcription factor PosF21 [Gastrolobium bilobum]